MSFGPFRKIRVAPGATITDKHINDVQTNIALATDQITNRDNLDRITIKGITLLPGITNKVSHTLGRNLNGYVIVRTHGSYNMIYDNQDTNKSPHIFLYLLSPCQVTCDIEVF